MAQTHTYLWKKSKQFLTLSRKQALVFKCLQYKSFENIAGKGEIAGNKQFLLFQQCFLPLWRTFCHPHHIQNGCLQTLSIWKSLKFVIWERFKPRGANTSELTFCTTLLLDQCLYKFSKEFSKL